MSLYRIEPFGRNGFLKEAPYSEDLKRLKNRLSEEQSNELYVFIRQSLSVEREFNIAGKYGSTSLAWQNVPLIYLYQVASENEGIAAKLLGLMVMDVLIADHRHWECWKTQMPGRDFATNYYRLKEAA